MDVKINQVVLVKCVVKQKVESCEGLEIVVMPYEFTKQEFPVLKTIAVHPDDIVMKEEEVPIEKS